ncbi:MULTISPECIES: hypothetical protein [Anaerofustis]|uniref:hypothetical protein n=1 Tax=Anaerofustis TaxID=264995 RepID=UPI001485544B|nr:MULTISPECIES: hypothetical protein [Anaerofustis]MCO8194258.1 hypothetical protein [Anaerofustis sp. NSJ-163]
MCNFLDDCSCECLLMFFLLLVVLFNDCEMFGDDPCSLLFFFLLLIVLFTE